MPLIWIDIQNGFTLPVHYITVNGENLVQYITVNGENLVQYITVNGENPAKKEKAITQ